MNPIFTALASNVSIDEILGYLIKRYPHMREKIGFALDSGYKPNDIIAMLKSYDKKAFKQTAENPISKKESEYLMTRRGRKLTQAEQAASNVMQTREKKKEQLKNVGKAALVTAGGYAAAQAIPALLSRLGRGVYPSEILPAQKALPGPQARRGLPAPGPQAPTAPTGTPGAPPTKPSPQPAPPAGQGTPQTPGPLTPPNAPRAPNPKHTALIKQMGIEGIIQGLSGKEDPATIAQVLDQHFLKPAQKKWISEQTQEPLENVIADYLAEQPRQPSTETRQELPSEAIQPSPTTDLLPEPTKLVEEKPIEQPQVSTELAKGDTVTLPNGKQGKIKDLAKKVATVVRDDGRTGQYRVQDLKKLEEAKPKAQGYAPALYQMPGESNEDWEKRKTVAKASKKAAWEIMQGKTFLDFGPIPKEALGISGISVADDVLSFLAGAGGAYELLDEDDRKEIEDVRDKYGAQITPNMVWNMLVVQEPKLAKSEIRPKSVKRGKEMLKTGQMGSSEFRRSLTHMVYGMISGKDISTELHDKIKKISTARTLSEHFVDAFKHGKMQKMSEEMDKLMDDEYFNSLFTDEIEEMVKKYR